MAGTDVFRYELRSGGRTAGLRGASLNQLTATNRIGGQSPISRENR